MVRDRRRQALLALLPLSVYAVLLGAEAYRGHREPALRLVCERVSADPSGLTVRVVKPAHLNSGTTFAVQYGDGSRDGSSDGSPGRAKVTQPYKAHGTYEVRARMHLPSNQLQDYSRTCEV